MLLMQEPELLLVDEPVAGMTPQEIERTAELLLSLAGEHSVVVVEHDMDFVRSIAKRVTVLHEGRVLAEGDMDQVQNDPARHRSLSGSVSVLTIKSPQSILRRQPHPVGRRSFRARRLAASASWAATAWARPRCSNASWDCCRRLPAAITFDGVGSAANAAAEERARIGIGYVPQGREIFSHLTVEENLKRGSAACARTAHGRSRSASSICSRC